MFCSPVSARTDGFDTQERLEQDLVVSNHWLLLFALVNMIIFIMRSLG